MTIRCFFSLSLLFMTGRLAVAQPSASTNALADERSRASYALGMNLGREWKDAGADLDPDPVGRGLKNSLAGGVTLLTEKQMTEALAQFTRKLQQQHRAQLAATNRLQGEAFLAANRTRAGVVALPGGLQYQVLAEGAGPSPDLTNWVTLKYHGIRINGAEFAGSDAHPTEGIFTLRNVIPGWTDALQMMKPGAKWRLFVPPDQAYGSDGDSDAGPDETLIYDLELVAILPGRPELTAEDLKNEREPDGD